MNIKEKDYDSRLLPETMEECKRFNNNGCGKVILDDNICEEDNICGFIFCHDECEVCDNCGCKKKYHHNEGGAKYCEGDEGIELCECKEFKVREVNERGTENV